MGHRALVGKTLKNGEVEVYYSHWGALNAYDAGKEKPKVPDEPKQIYKVKDKFAFGKKVDYLHHEAIWLDDVCYCPIWIMPSNSVTPDKWVTEGFGILIKSETGNEFNIYNNLSNNTILIDDLTPELSIINKIELIINNIAGNTSLEDVNIPEFSPFGYKHKYENMSELLKKMQKGETPCKECGIKLMLYELNKR